MKRIVIGGGGIAGLATALRLRDLAPEGTEILVLESGDRLGGNIRTQREDGFTVEWGPNGYLDNVPTTSALIERIGLQEQVQPADERAARRFLFRGGRLHELATSPLKFFGSPVLSLRGRLRILGEPFARPKPPDEDETVGAFASRRIGPEAARILVDAMVSGVFAGNVDRLSLASAFPKMARMEAEHGSLVRAMIAAGRARKRARKQPALAKEPASSNAQALAKQPASSNAQALAKEPASSNAQAPAKQPASSNAQALANQPASSNEQAPRGSGGPAGPGGTLTSFRDGLDSLIAQLGEVLGPSIRLRTSIQGLERNEASGAWLVRTSVGEAEGSETIEADVVVLSMPGQHAASILAPLDPGLGAEVGEIPTAPLAVVALAYEAQTIGGDPDGFGFLVPRGQGPRILGCLWDSSLFPGRAPQGKVLLRAMIGGAHDPTAVDLSDEELLAEVRRDLRITMGLTAEPVRSWIFRHRLGIAQYETGHEARLARIHASLDGHPGLWLAGSSYYGVAMNACIENAERQAMAIVGYLQAQRPAEAGEHPIEAAARPAEAGEHPIEAADRPVEAADRPAEAAQRDVSRADSAIRG